MSKTTCYQCEEAIEVAEISQVHPLCAECQNESDDWLQYQMGMFA